MEDMKEKILTIIEKNSKIGISDLAILLGEREETVAEAIFEMEKDKTICGYHTMINWDKVSQDRVIALIEVCVIPQRSSGFDHLAERIYNFPEVESVYLMSGSYDFLIMLDGKSIREVSTFVSEKLSTLESITSTTTHFVLKKYKDHGTIMIQENKAERQLMTP